jgi:Dolichyl-phosphate-mannose-protein mannosyltransferase
MWLLALKAMFGVSLITLASVSVGLRIANKLPAGFNLLDRIACGLLGGMGLLGLGLFLVGQLFFTSWSILIVLCVAIISGAPLLRRLVENQKFFLGHLRRVPKVPAAIVLLVLSLTAVTGLAQITKGDAAVYHLLGPKVWLRNGVIRPVPDNSHTAFPQTAESLFGALFAMGGPRAPGFSSFVTLAMLLLIASSLAIRSGLDASGAWWVAAVISTMPAIYAGSVGCFVDGIFAAFCLAAIRVGVEANRLSDWAIFGMFCGLAMGTKYTGILAFPAITLCVLWLHIREAPKELHVSLKQILVAIVVAWIVAAPYYLRNWILLGCPIYPPPPGLARFCSPRYLSPAAVSHFHDYIRQRGAGLGRGLAAFVLLPFNLTYYTSSFHGEGGIGLVPLGLGPLGLLIASPKNTFVKMTAFLGFILTLTWFVTQQESRFLIHVYVITTIFAVAGWRHVTTNNGIVSRLLAAAIVTVSMAYGLVMMSRGWSRSLPAVISRQIERARNSEDIGYFESFQYLNNAPDVRKVLILDPTVVPFSCDKDYVKPVGHWGERSLPGAPDGRQALEQVHRLAISHVLDVNSENAPFQIIGERTGLTLVFESKDQRIYRVDY